ncbi:hypothetical protein MOQ_000967 [Trypanosoma cruzi marinkellei]|uniref:Uncharacterized protein n=1 Tax=Trypanosoma cruzi marinkellei TaxID=85056 RepID=K2NM15_TRYCR|nr:hypothetical protein MOQ_000967 [Trypanosoma cruzi marinkellei]
MKCCCCCCCSLLFFPFFSPCATSHVLYILCFWHCAESEGKSFQKQKQRRGTTRKMDVWRCSVCGKTKELSGKHLEGKTSVRSDCWPCAKKCTFVRESLAVSRSAAQVVTAPCFFNPNLSTSLEKSKTAASTMATTGVASNLFAASTAFTNKTPFAGTPNTWKGTTASNNPFNVAADAFAAAGKQLETEAAARKNAFFSSEKAFPIVMHSAPATDRPRQSPPFAFTSSPTAVMSLVNDNAKSGNTPSNNGHEGITKPVWRCSVCGKTKELSGKHLEGKTSVRSDCWPCAKKRVFVLSHPESCVSSEPNLSIPFSTTLKLTASPNNRTRDVISISQGASPLPSATRLWQDPVVPSNDQDANAFIMSHLPRQPSAKEQLDQTRRSVSLESSSPSVLLPSLAMTFEGEVLRGYRQQLVDGIRTRAAWHDCTLYVLAPEKSGGKGPNTACASQLGAAAVVFLAAEHKLALSPFRRMRRIFCPDEFTFAAACLYANTFLAGHPTSSQQSSFVVYGPQVDHTVPMTRWGPIIENCTHARQRVVSEELRVEGAQSIFRCSGWLTLPLHATAEAIRLLEVQQQQEHAEKNAAECLGVDVVFVAETMRLEDLPQAAALALPVKPF